MELRAFTHFAFHPDASAMNFDKVLGDAESETGAARFSGTGRVHTIKAFKDARLV
jgi:hypothetical protein